MSDYDKTTVALIAGNIVGHILTEPYGGSGKAIDELNRLRLAASAKEAVLLARAIMAEVERTQR